MEKFKKVLAEQLKELNGKTKTNKRRYTIALINLPNGKPKSPSGLVGDDFYLISSCGAYARKETARNNYGTHLYYFINSVCSVYADTFKLKAHIYHNKNGGRMFSYYKHIITHGDHFSSTVKHKKIACILPCDINGIPTQKAMQGLAKKHGVQWLAPKEQNK